MDALSKLQEFSWRGVKYPITSAQYGYRHEAAEHKLAFGDVSVVEQLGRRNPTFSYTIPMQNNIASGPYKQLFKKVLSLDAAMRDRSPGPLTDPVWGNWQVKPVSLASSTEANNRNGVMVEVQFIWAPELEQELIISGGIADVAGLTDEAGKLDAEVKRVFSKNQEPSPGPATDPLSAIAGVGQQLDRAGDKISANIQRFSYQTEKIEAATVRLVRRTRDPDGYGIIRACRRQRASAARLLRQGLDPSRIIVPVVVGQTKHVLSLASELGMTVKEFALINPTALASPLIQAGTKINAYRR